MKQHKTKANAKTCNSAGLIVSMDILGSASSRRENTMLGNSERRNTAKFFFLRLHTFVFQNTSTHNLYKCPAGNMKINRPFILFR